MSSLPSARSSPGTPPWVVPIRSPRERLTLSPLYRFHAPLLFRMRCAQVWELPQDVGVGLEARGRTLIFRQEGDAIVDHVVREDPAVGILCGSSTDRNLARREACPPCRSRRSLPRACNCRYAPSDARTGRAIACGR